MVLWFMIFLSVYPTKRVNSIGNAMEMGGSMQISTLGPGHMGMGGGGMPPQGGAGECICETMEVPDHCVGLGIIFLRFFCSSIRSAS